MRINIDSLSGNLFSLRTYVKLTKAWSMIENRSWGLKPCCVSVITLRTNIFENLVSWFNQYCYTRDNLPKNRWLHSASLIHKSDALFHSLPDMASIIPLLLTTSHPFPRHVSLWLTTLSETCRHPYALFYPEPPESEASGTRLCSYYTWWRGTLPRAVTCGTTVKRLPHRHCPPRLVKWLWITVNTPCWSETRELHTPLRGYLRCQHGTSSFQETSVDSYITLSPGGR